MRQQPTENQLHASIAELLDWLLLPPAMYTTFPAGGYALSKALGGILKRRGLKAGMPDMLAFFDGRTIGIELKIGKKKASDVQLDTFGKLEKAGIHVYVCRSQEDVIEALKHCEFPLREMKHEARYPAPRNGGVPARSGARRTAPVQGSQVSGGVSPDRGRLPDGTAQEN